MQKLSLTDSVLSRLQDNVANALLPLEQGQLVRTTLVKDQALTTSDTEVQHGLGYPVTGYMVVRRNGTATVYDGSGHATPGKIINLKASAAVTVTLLFF